MSENPVTPDDSMSGHTSPTTPGQSPPTDGEKRPATPSYGTEVPSQGTEEVAASSRGPARGPQPSLDEIQELQRQRDQYLDQLQRTRAEFSNYQKRSKALADAERPFAISSLARDLLTVLDNLERAIEAARTAGAPGIVEGVEMVYRQLVDILAKHDIEPIPALGQPFDPSQHEAITQQPDPEHPEGTVVAELGKGYRLRDRVLRPSKVAVSVRPPA
jgi:molecular chaperone GrpE